MDHDVEFQPPSTDPGNPSFAKRRETVLSWLLAFFLGTVSWLLIQDAIRVEKAARDAFGGKTGSAKPGPDSLTAIRLSNVPILVLGSGQGQWRVDPPQGVAIIEGDPEEMKQIELRGLRLFVDVSGLSKPGRYEVPVRLYLPGFPALLSARTDPERVFLEWITPAATGEERYP
jgi:hypothetical protein